MYMRGSLTLLMLLLCGADNPRRAAGSVKSATFVYVTQDLQKRTTRSKKTRASPYELLIVDTFSNQHGGERQTWKSDRHGPTRCSGGADTCCVTWIFGQAEEYRTYWDKAPFNNDWKGASANHKGKPDSFSPSIRPGGMGNYPVAFWTHAGRPFSSAKRG